MEGHAGAVARPGARHRHVGLHAFRDYAFAPGRTGFDQRMRELLQRRPQTILIAANNIAEFINNLQRRQLANNPIRHLIIVSHANPEGRLQISLDAAHPDATYEDFEAVRPPPNGTGSIMIPARILAPRPMDGNGRQIPASFHVRGCRIGTNRTIPFLRLLKDCLGSGLQVTAPKHFNAAAIQTRPAGRAEYMFYGFTINRPNPFRNRVQAINEFAADGNLTLIDGSRIGRSQWNAWIPVRWIPLPRQLRRRPRWALTSPMRAQIINPVTGNQEQLPAQFRYNKRPLFSVRQSLALGADPGTNARRKQAVRDVLVRQHARYRDDHPFPEYIRFGYSSMDEFMDGWEWDFRWQRANNTLDFQATRYEHTVVRPIVDPATNRLFLNFYPSFPRRAASVIQLQENDARFFTTI